MRFLRVSLIIIMLLVICSIDLKASNELELDNLNHSIVKNSATIPFVKNHTNYADSIYYYADILSGKCFVTESNRVYYTWQDSIETFSFIESYISVNVGRFTKKQKSKTKVNYFHGNDSDRWQSNINTAQSLEYANIYPCIDLELLAYNNNIEKIFTVHQVEILMI